MIRADFYKREGEFFSFKVNGHADFSEYGNDIVCASVSSGVMLVCNTITECFNVKSKVEVLENEISFSLEKDDINASKVIEGLFIHLSCLSQDYEGHIKVNLL